MCDPVTALAVTAAVVTAGSQVYAGAAANAQGKYEQQVAQENRKHELAAAEDAKRRGTVEEMRRMRVLAQQIGQQRATMAAGGLDLSFGTPAAIVDDTRMIGMEDVAAIRENTTKEIKGYDINAANFTMQGRAARARGKAAMTGSLFQAAGTLLGGAQQVSGIKAGRA